MWFYSPSKNKWDCVICRELRPNGKTGGGWDTEGKSMSHSGPVEACYQLKITSSSMVINNPSGKVASTEAMSR